MQGKDLIHEIRKGNTSDTSKQEKKKPPRNQGDLIDAIKKEQHGKAAW